MDKNFISGRQKNDLQDAKKIQRYDWVDSPFPLEEFLYEKPVMTDEGYLKGRSVLTNVGVFPYLMEDGSIRWELRPPEEVFDLESISTLKMKPITNNHPEFLVLSDNIKEVQVGNLGENYTADEYHLSYSWTVTDKETIQDIENGKRAWSCGYTADFEEKQGTWMGVPYDGVQRNIKYNHCALVEKGRAGDAAVIRMDAMTDKKLSVLVPEYTNKNRRKDKMPEKSLRKLHIDGVEFEAEDAVISAYQDSVKKMNTVNAELETIKADKSKIEAERDTLKTQLDSVTKEKETLEKSKVDEVEIQKQIDTRIDLFEVAGLAKVDVSKEMKNDAIKKAVILALDETAKEKLDTANVVYVQARYDMAAAILRKQAKQDKEETEEQNELLHSDEFSIENSSEKNDTGKKTGEQMRNDYIEHLKSLSQKGGKK